MPRDSSLRQFILWGLVSGAAVCGAVFFVFGDGWRMGLYLAVEGVLLGSILGSLFGLLVLFLKRLVSRRP